jgi:formylglycine-generating enzyme required for sulfatase activity
LTIKTSREQPFKRLVSSLNKIGLTSVEIADAVWLASQVHGSDPIEFSQTKLIELRASQDVENSENLDDVDSSPINADLASLQIQETTTLNLKPEDSGRISLKLPPSYQAPSISCDTSVISQAPLLGKALRPFIREVSIGESATLDEEATVEFFANNRVWQPMTLPESQRWLDVALVIDTSPSMELWQQLDSELHRLLLRYGEFRDIRTWYIKHKDSQIRLISRNSISDNLDEEYRWPKELLVEDRRRIVIVVSDCVGPSWHNGQMRKLISVWSSKLPVAILQVFPERLWQRTALGRSIPVELQSRQEILPSDQLQPFEYSAWDRERLEKSLEKKTVHLPVVTLEHDSLQGWAKVVSGDSRFRVSGIVWDAQPQTLETSKISVRDRMDSFLLTASPQALRLAKVLASAPLITLPVINLIKRDLNLGEIKTVHIAEVLMSGLLNLTFKGEVPEKAERRTYELPDENMRSRLRYSSTDSEALAVYISVYEHVANSLDQSISGLWNLICNPDRGKDPEEVNFLKALANSTVKVLRPLGGRCEGVANQIIPSTGKHANALTDSDIGLEQFVFTIITIQEQAQRRWFQRNSDWSVVRQQGKANQFVQILDDSVAPPLTIEMVSVPQGTFMMGSADSLPVSEISENEKPQHRVTVEEFFMGRYPITQAQWRFVAGLEIVNRNLEREPSHFVGDELPVDSINWYEAVEFCERLSRHTGRQYSLPTEAQWEYACRAGTSSLFHFGDIISPEFSNYQPSESSVKSLEGEYREKTTPVSYFKNFANNFGLCDMHGNVLEWCLDQYTSYDRRQESAGENNTIGDQKDVNRALRGGCWFYGAKECRSASREFYQPNDKHYNFGLRIVCLPSSH